MTRLVASFFIVGSFIALGAEKADPWSNWGGLVQDKCVAGLPGACEAQCDGSNFVMGLLRDAKAYDGFVKAAGIDTPASKNFDWDKEAVLVVVLKASTNSLKPRGFAAKDGVGKFAFEWSMIEPDYGDRNPAAMQRVPLKDLKKIECWIDGKDKPLGEIAVK